MALTARHVVRTLGEHAMAFWNYYNPSGRPLDQLDTELSENTINGILLTCLYDRSVTEQTFAVRVRNIVALSHGAIQSSEAGILVARAYGYRYRKQLRNAWRLGGSAPNLLHLPQPTAVTGNTESKQGRARNVAKTVELYGDRDGLLNHIATLDTTEWNEVSRLCHAMRVFMSQAKMKSSHEAVAHALGYPTYNTLMGAIDRYGRVPNLKRNPGAISEADLAAVREQRVQKNVERDAERAARARAKRNGNGQI